MHWRVGLLVAAAAAAWALPGASAADPAPAVDVPAPAAPARCSSAPPCGWIQPEFQLDFPEKPTCRNGNRAPADPEKCLKLPLKGESLSQSGTMRWWWDVTLDGTYPLLPPNPDIEISFTGTGMNPKWMSATVDPDHFSVSQQTMADPANYEYDVSDPNRVKVYFAYKEPITVTFTRTGDPTPKEMQRVEDNGGVVAFTIKAVSTESGSFFKAAFGTELFNFWPTDFGGEPASEGNRNAPVPLAPLAVGVAGLGFALRRRFA